MEIPERRVQQGPVVYCAFEGAAGFHKRAEAFRRKHNGAAKRPLLPHADAGGFGDAITRSSSPPSTLRQVAPLRRLPRYPQPVSRRLREQGRGHGRYIAAADALREAFDCLVVIVHHCGINDTRPRGHTSLTGAVDAQLAVKRDGAGNVVVTLEWMKDGAEGELIVSRLDRVEVGTDEDSDPITSCVVVPADDEVGAATSPARPSRMTKTAATALRALRVALDAIGEVAPHLLPRPTGVTVSTSMPGGAIPTAWAFGF